VARRIASAVPTSHLLVIEDCGHFSFLEHPDRIRACITEFLSSH
jgi:pimeloyl-ACP methyl ester carboxylesterase